MKNVITFDEFIDNVCGYKYIPLYQKEIIKKINEANKKNERIYIQFGRHSGRTIFDTMLYCYYKNISYELYKKMANPNKIIIDENIYNEYMNYFKNNLEERNEQR